MLFFCLWCNVETSCHKHLKSSPAIDKLRRLLKAISVTTVHRLAAPPLERSSTRGYASSDSRRFPKAARNVSFLSFVHVVTDARNLPWADGTVLITSGGCSVDSTQWSQILVENREFCLPHLNAMPPSGGFLLEYCHDIWYGKTRMVWLRDGGKYLKICLFVSTECTNVTDGWTDRQTLHDGIGRAYA